LLIVARTVSDAADNPRRRLSAPVATVVVMAGIEYMRGDATAPDGKGVRVIAHVCNDRGGWGKGFVLALSKRWPQPEAEYRAWHRERARNDFGLGALQMVQVDRLLWVANLIGQHGTRTSRSSGVPVRYEAIGQALAKLVPRALELGASVHMPRIGCGLAGGRWERVEPLIEATLVSAGIPVTVYDHD
jgi:O-acetyl-ADP-ribose deacetylase (regulator of RNase III)